MTAMNALKLVIEILIQCLRPCENNMCSVSCYSMRAPLIFCLLACVNFLQSLLLGARNILQILKLNYLVGYYDDILHGCSTT